MNLSALSGMRAADLQLTTTADNTANLETPGYHERRTDLATSTSGGVTATVSEATQPGVDLATQMTNLITGSLLYTANARMLRAGLQTERTALDLLA